ncbi:MAG: hypothetical protein OEW75_05815 [Cyclobacteriaceae bacterium]|nr:hypothetical protein [Cyclobacteriaceae bacterium]
MKKIELFYNTDFPDYIHLFVFEIIKQFYFSREYNFFSMDKSLKGLSF